MSDAPITAYLGFAAIKWAGYTLAAWWLGRRYGRARGGAGAVGGARTLVGLVVGLGYGAALAALGDPIRTTPATAYYVALFPIRMLEWGLVLWLFHRPAWQPQRASGIVTLAALALWSYVLDIPAAIGALLTGGRWFC